MGAFHEGHLELMRTAKRECGFCVVSLFVNPTQFAPGEDFQRYPRDEDRDFDLARTAGVDVLFAPSTESVYPRKTTTVQVSGISQLWEGAHRPGHFDGVSTVVCKLFHLVRPRVAFFGTKDYQQCLVVQRMVEDLNMPVSLRFVETVREHDGLALSSRNRYLSPEHRGVAPLLYSALSSAARELSTAPQSTREGILNQQRSRLIDAGFELEYFALVDARTMEPFLGSSEGRLVVAARIGDTRLIDNIGVQMQRIE